MEDSWDRSQLLNEVREQRGLLNRQSDVKSTDYYDGTIRFKEIRKCMEPIEGDQVYIKITESNPEGTLINAMSSIHLDRVGYLENESTPFESSIHDSKPDTLNLAEGPILPGLLLGILKMRERERAEILIHPAMAYGRLGCLPLIPGDAWLLYYIKIHKVWTESHLDTFVKYERDHLTEVPLEHKISLIEEHKVVANNYLRDGFPKEALVRYKAAIKCLDELPETKLAGSTLLTKLLTTLLVNAAITLNQLGMPKSATKMAKRALSVEPDNLKAFYQIIKARLSLCDYDKALMWLDKANKVSPNNPSFDGLKLQLDSKVESDKERRSEMLKKMSKACFSSADNLDE